MHILICYLHAQDKGYRCSATCNPESSVVNSLGLKCHSCCQSLKCGFYSFIIESESFHSHAVALSLSGLSKAKDVSDLFVFWHLEKLYLVKHDFAV